MMKTRILCQLLCAFLLLTLLPATASAAGQDAQNKAAALAHIDLFKGVAPGDFDLDRAPTRLESIVIFLRLLSYEDEALSQSLTHPFYDVPDWGDPYIGYAYQNGYTNGLSATTFGANDATNSAAFLTFVLRALGYEDGSDFTWHNPYTLASEIGILSSDVNQHYFTRGDAAIVCWDTLHVAPKGHRYSLMDAMVMVDEITIEQAVDAAAIAENGLPHPDPEDFAFTTYICEVDANGNSYATFYDPYLVVSEDQTFRFSINYGEGSRDVHGIWSASVADAGYTNLRLVVTDTDRSLGSYFDFRLDGGHFTLLNNYAGVTPPGSQFKNLAIGVPLSYTPGTYTCYTDIYGFDYGTAAASVTLGSNYDAQVTFNYGEGLAYGHGGIGVGLLSDDSLMLTVYVNSEVWDDSTREYNFYIRPDGLTLADPNMGVVPGGSLFAGP